MQLVLFTSAFCEPCMQTRTVMVEVAKLLPQATITELDIVAHEDEARAEGIRTTPTVIVRNAVGEDVFRAEGVPTLQQVLVAAAKGL